MFSLSLKDKNIDTINNKNVYPPGVVANVKGSNNVFSEFELQTCYNVHFQTNTYRQSSNLLRCGTRPYEWVWFGLVSMFNGISTFVGYLMPKLFS